MERYRARLGERPRSSGTRQKIRMWRKRRIRQRGQDGVVGEAIRRAAEGRDEPARSDADAGGEVGEAIRSSTEDVYQVETKRAC